MATTTDELLANTSLIPDPQAIRDRLYSVRMEARLLARLLKVAEDKVKVLRKPAAKREAVTS